MDVNSESQSSPIAPAGPVDDLSDKEQRIYDYLCDTLDEGNPYYKSGGIGEETGLSRREVGINMSQLSKKTTMLSIEQWSTTSPVTWLVTRDTDT